jgi:hypothetical protein
MGKLQEVLSGLKQITGKAASSAVKATTQKVATEKKDDSLWGKLKSFAKSDTGKALGMAAGTIAAGKYGGAQGINALSSAIERSRMREKEEAAEAERKKDLDETRNLRKLNTVRSELDIERGREDLSATKNKNYADLQQKLMGFGMGVPAATGKISGSKAGATTPDPDKGLTKPPAATPKTAANEDMIQKDSVDAAKWAAKLAQQMGIVGAGIQELKANRDALNQELKATGMSDAQQAAAWKEFSRQVAPEYYAQQEAITAAGPQVDYAGDESAARLQEGAFKTAGTAGGAMLGASIGTGILPGIGTVAGGIIGGATGYAGSRALGDVTFSGQADATSTPAVAGADKSAADNMATYEDDNRYAMQIARGLERAGAGPQDTDQIMAQLSQIPSIAENKERRDKIIKLVRWHFSQNPEPASQWMNERAWR